VHGGLSHVLSNYGISIAETKLPSHVHNSPSHLACNAKVNESDESIERAHVHNEYHSYVYVYTRASSHASPIGAKKGSSASRRSGTDISCPPLAYRNITGS
jgi:hypothetical protein